MVGVSVVIPTRNRWHLLERFGLRSALSQEGVELEVIVVDDGSTDGTADRWRDVRDDRLRVLTSSGHNGVARARNAGIDEATGAFVAFLDDDDAWSPLKLRKQLDVIRAAGADLAYTSVVVTNDNGVPLGVVPAPAASTLADQLLRRNVLIGASNVIVRRSLVCDVGGFDEELMHLADWELWIRLAQRGRLAACEETLVAWVSHNENLTLSEIDATPEFKYIMEKHPTVARTPRAEISGSRWRANALRRRGCRREAVREYGRTAWRYRSSGDLMRAMGTLAGDRVMDLASGRHRSRESAPSWLTAFWE